MGCFIDLQGTNGKDKGKRFVLGVPKLYAGIYCCNGNYDVADTVTYLRHAMEGRVFDNYGKKLATPNPSAYYVPTEKDEVLKNPREKMYFAKLPQNLILESEKCPTPDCHDWLYRTVQRKRKFLERLSASELKKLVA